MLAIFKFGFEHKYLFGNGALGMRKECGITTGHAYTVVDMWESV